MRFSIFHFLTFTICCFKVASQNPVSDNVIEWNEYYDLQWSDFQGKPGEEAAGDAGTAVEIKAKPYRVKKAIDYDVYVLFNRKKSWYRDTSNALLRHERLHFDIAEIYGRRIRKKIREMKAEGVNDVARFNQVIRELLAESDAEDIRYDMETLHGAITKKQRVWEQSVKNELQSLEPYKKQKHVISRGTR